MRKLLLTLLFTMLITNFHTLFLKSQTRTREETRGFSLPLEIGQGLNSLDSASSELYLATVYIKPSYTFAGNQFGLGATGMISYTDKVVDYFGGPQVFVKIFPLGSPSAFPLYKIYLTGEALWGTRDKKLFGGGIEFRANPIFASINARQENTNKQFWFDASFGLNLEFFFKKQENDDPTH